MWRELINLQNDVSNCSIVVVWPLQLTRLSNIVQKMATVRRNSSNKRGSHFNLVRSLNQVFVPLPFRGCVSLYQVCQQCLK